MIDIISLCKICLQVIMNFNHYELYLKLFTWKIKDSISDYKYPEYFYPVLLITQNCMPVVISEEYWIMIEDINASSASLS